MNWLDVAVLALIGVFAIIGLSNGFIFSIFRLVSFFISIFLSLKLYPFLSSLLIKIGVYGKIQAAILKNLLGQAQVLAPDVDNQAKQVAADSIIKNLKLPGFLKGTLINKLPNPSELVDFSEAIESISNELANIITSIISLILIYIIVRIILIFARVILRGIAKLPIFKQMDKLGGLAFGAVEGLLTVNVFFAVLMLFNSNPKFEDLFAAIESSLIASFFYQNNFIINWMFN